MELSVGRDALLGMKTLNSNASASAGFWFLSSGSQYENYYPL